MNTVIHSSTSDLGLWSKMRIAHDFDIDPRISPKQFMDLLGCKTTSFYEKIKKGEIKKPHHDGKKITYWHASYAKEIVEKNKYQLEDFLP